MSFDLFQSRRTYNELCKWWSRNESDEFDDSKLIFKRIPNGIFMAKEVTPENAQDNIIGGTFLLDKTVITIKTPDNVDCLKNHDIVLYRGEIWIVVNVQKSKARIQQTEFATDKYCSHYWYIELRK